MPRRLITDPTQARRIAQTIGTTRPQLIISADSSIPAGLYDHHPAVELIILGVPDARDAYNQTVHDLDRRGWAVYSRTIHAVQHGRQRYWYEDVRPETVFGWFNGVTPPSRQSVRTITETRQVEPDWESMFTDWRDTLQWLIQVAWVKRIPPTEKPSRPLQPMRISEDCPKPPETARLNAVAETLMDVLTGHADVHRPHPLARHGKPVIGPWGNPVIRCSIPRVPSGPRVHYTLDDTGTVVLLDVSLHDDLIRD